MAPSHATEGAALMSRDMIGLVALDLILGIVCRCMMCMPFVIEILDMDGDDRPRHAACLGIPAHTIPDLEAFGHPTDSVIYWKYGPTENVGTETLSLRQVFGQLIDL